MGVCLCVPVCVIMWKCGCVELLFCVVFGGMQICNIKFCISCECVLCAVCLCMCVVCTMHFMHAPIYGLLLCHDVPLPNLSRQVRKCFTAISDGVATAVNHSGI